MADESLPGGATGLPEPEVGPVVSPMHGRRDNPDLLTRKPLVLWDRIKLLLYEHGGYVLWCKRLERGTLELPHGEGAVRMSWQQLVLMIEGVPLVQPRARLRWQQAQITTPC